MEINIEINIYIYMKLKIFSLLHISKFYNCNCNSYFKQNNLYKEKKIIIKTKKETRDHFYFQKFYKIKFIIVC